MKTKNNEGGALNSLVVSLIFASVLFVATLGFAVWAFTSRQDYKDNSDQKAAAAAKVAEQNTATAKDNEYLEKEKYPLKNFSGPSNLGAVSLSYPKTWSAYVSPETDNFFIFNPDVVTAGTNQLYALKISILSTNYNDTITQFSSQVQQGNLKAKAYSLPKVPSVTGVRFDGAIDANQTGSLVVLPLRDKTLEIFCQIPEREKDFNKIILPNLTFNP